MILGAALALAYALAWLPMFVFRVEEIGVSVPFYGRAERFAVRLAPVILSLHVALACLVLNLGPPPPGWPIAAAAVLYAGALWFWWSGRRRIGPFRRRRLPDEPPLAFRRDGAFALVRHPLYFSYVLLLLVPVVATANPLVAATFVASFAAVAVRAAQEERRLRQQLGAEYDEYCRHVRHLIPFVW